MDEVKNEEIDFEFEEFDFVGEEAINLCINLLQKNPEGRLGAVEALDHCFISSAFSRYKKSSSAYCDFKHLVFGSQNIAL